jgi:small subunit ribosomal protein S18
MRPRRPRSKDRFVPRRKVCGFCAEKLPYIDYKDVNRLRRYLSERGKIEPRRKTGTCARHQRALTVALKRARHVALLPFVGPHARKDDFGLWILALGAVTKTSDPPKAKIQKTKL